MNYAEFKDHLTDFLWKASDAALIARLDQLITMAEHAINRTDLTEARKASVDFIVTSTELNFPPDCRLILSVASGSGNFTRVSPGDIKRRKHGWSGWQGIYAITGNKLLLAGPEPVGGDIINLTITYRQKVPAFKDVDTSWLVDDYLDLYTYGTLIHSAPYLREDDRIQMWAGLYDKALQDAIDELLFRGSGGTYQGLPPSPTQTERYRGAGISPAAVSIDLAPVATFTVQPTITPASVTEGGSFDLTLGAVDYEGVSTEVDYFIVGGVDETANIDLDTLSITPQTVGSVRFRTKATTTGGTTYSNELSAEVAALPIPPTAYMDFDALTVEQYSDPTVISVLPHFRGDDLSFSATGDEVSIDGSNLTIGHEEARSDSTVTVTASSPHGPDVSLSFSVTVTVVYINPVVGTPNTLSIIEETPNSAVVSVTLATFNYDYAAIEHMATFAGVNVSANIVYVDAVQATIEVSKTASPDSLSFTSVAYGYNGVNATTTTSLTIAEASPPVFTDAPALALVSETDAAATYSVVAGSASYGTLTYVITLNGSDITSQISGGNITVGKALSEQALVLTSSIAWPGGVVTASDSETVAIATAPVFTTGASLTLASSTNTTATYDVVYGTATSGTVTNELRLDGADVRSQINAGQITVTKKNVTQNLVVTSTASWLGDDVVSTFTALVDTEVLVDDTPPMLSFSLSETDGDIDGTATVSEDATVFFVITDNATAPTNTRVVAGQDHTGDPADYAWSVEVVAPEVVVSETVPLTGSYYIHAAARDAAMNVSDTYTVGPFYLGTPPPVEDWIVSGSTLTASPTVPAPTVSGSSITG